PSNPRVATMIPVKCESCGRNLKVKDELAGKKGKCPGCGRVLPIPAAAPVLMMEPAQAAPARGAGTFGFAPDPSPGSSRPAAFQFGDEAPPEKKKKKPKSQLGIWSIIFGILALPLAAAAILPGTVESIAPPAYFVFGAFALGALGVLFGVL